MFVTLSKTRRLITFNPCPLPALFSSSNIILYCSLLEQVAERPGQNKNEPRQMRFRFQLVTLYLDVSD